MTKTTIILRSALAVCVPVSMTGMVPLITQSSQKHVDNAQRPINPDMLLIEGGTLKGFKPGITPDDIRENNYNTLVVPDSVAIIAPYAFAYVFDGKSTPVTNLVLGKNVTTICAGAFLDCYGITNAVNFKDTKLTRIEQDAFNFCQDMFLKDDSEEPGVIEFPDSLKYIGSCAFKNCEWVKKIILPNSLDEVGDYAFQHCVDIKTVDLTKYKDVSGKQTLPKWLGKKSWAFSRLGEDATDQIVMINDFGTSAEDWKDMLQSNLNLSESFEITVGDKEMKDDTTLKLEKDELGNQILAGIKDGVTLSNYVVIRVPEDVKEIKEEAFKDKIKGSQLRIIFNDKLEKINKGAFDGCSGLVGQINLPNSVTLIDEASFRNTSVSGKLVLPHNDFLTSVGKEAFKNTKIRELIIPEQFCITGEEKQEVFKSGAFCNCSQLTLIDCHDFDPSVTPSWKGPEQEEDDLPFKDVGIHGTIIYPFNATQTVPIQQIGLKFEEIGLCEEVDSYKEWSASLYRNGEIKEFPYHPENPMQGVAFAVLGSELVSLSSDFSDETSLLEYKIINIPSNITKIREGAFFSSPASPFADPTADLSDPKFDYSWQLKFQLGLNEIGKDSFRDNTGIHGNVTFPTTLTTIGETAFYGCNAINSFTIPSSVTNIGENAFSQSTSKYPYGLLKYIDISQLSSIPSGWAANSFAELPDNGVIYVASGKTSLVDTLKTQCNLPSSWVAKEI